MTKRSLLLPLLLVAGSLQAQDTVDVARATPIVESICMACHGTDGNSALPDYPKLGGQFSEYLYKQLRDFKAADDGSAVRQEPVMNAMVDALSDEDMKAIAAYYAAQPAFTGEATNLETIELGQKIWRGGIMEKGVPACGSCHGPAGAGIPAQYPRLAGQHAQYMLKQLQAFREGGRTNDPAQMMQTIALKMTDAEMRAVADYAAGLYASQ
jgi:cytochrome c553